jgi:phosphonate transport system substrate-binding protein
MLEQNLPRTKSRRTFLVESTALATALVGSSLTAARAQAKPTLHFGVGPLMPTPDDTKKAWDPFFKFLADRLNVDYTLAATSDWAGIAVALANDQVDVAWLGPWGYVLANDDSGAEAIAMAKYDGKPIYHSIVIARKGITVNKWPDDAKGMRMSFADVGSTSGWLIPTYWFKSHGIDPKTYFNYSDGSTHANNEVAVQSGQVDLATDFDRNRNAMIEMGTIKKDNSSIVWTSDPLPNDAIAVRKGFDARTTAKLREVLVAMTPAQCAGILPKHYDGFVTADNDSYKMIQAAGAAVGRLKKK